MHNTRIVPSNTDAQLTQIVKQKTIIENNITDCAYRISVRL